LWKGPTVLATQLSSAQVMSYTGLSDNDQNGRTGGLLSYTANILRVLIVLMLQISLVASRRHFAMQVEEWATLIDEQTRSGNQLLADIIITVY